MSSSILFPSKLQVSLSNCRGVEGIFSEKEFKLVTDFMKDLLFSLLLTSSQNLFGIHYVFLGILFKACYFLHRLTFLNGNTVLYVR